MDLTITWPLWGLLLVPMLASALWWSLVDRPTWKRAASLGLRVLAVVLLLIALCRPFLSGSRDAMHVAFVVDVSESVDLGSLGAAADRIETAVAQLGPRDSWSLFVAAEGARSLPTPEDLRKLADTWQEGMNDDAFRSGSRLADALRSVRLTFPAGKARRIVLLSDGRPTGGAVADALAVLHEEAVDVRFAELAGLVDAEAAVVSLTAATPTAYQGEMVRLIATLASNTAMPAELRLVHKGVIVQRKDVALSPDDPPRVTFDVPMQTPGPSVWSVQLAPAEDRFAINNAATTTVTVRGEPRLLVLHREPRDMRDFARAMEQQQFDVDVRTPRGLPHRLDELLAFDAVLLADIPATEMEPRQMTLLKRYVADFGGGLMMLGSENSFGLGGYYQTPVEEVLPLISRFEKEKEKPSLAMVLVIDKSGSMNGLPIALARQAAKAAVELLGAQDQIGVVGFDSQPFVVTELRSAADRESVQSSIDRLGAGGGTFMYAGMAAAKLMLETAAAKVKHMIVLGDGVTQPADHMGLTADLAQMGVTVSTVALGPGADQQLMASIAEAGRGRYYQTMDPNSVPQIFTRETMQASKSAIKEDLYGSVQVGDHPMLAGFESSGLPLNLGFVMARPKPTAQVLLATETGDPLLAYSRFGLGAAMAYTSDLTPRWGAEWLAWPSFGKFWAQTLRALVRQDAGQGLAVTAEPVGETLQLSITATDDDATPASGLAWDAQAVDASGQATPIVVEQTGLGRYVAAVPLAGRESVTVRLHDRTRDKLRVLHHHRPYPAEYRLGRDVDAALAALPGFVPEQVRAEVTAVESRTRAEWLLISLALAAMLGGLLLRRV